MKRVLLALVTSVMPVVAADPSDAQRIVEATTPLPEHLRAGAKVVMTNADGSERVLRQGSNGFVCGEVVQRFLIRKKQHVDHGIEQVASPDHQGNSEHETADGA